MCARTHARACVCVEGGRGGFRCGFLGLLRMDTSCQSGGVMGVGLMSGSCRVQKVRVALDTAAQRTGGLFPLYSSATDCCDTRPLACPAPIHCAAGCAWRAHNADRAARCAAAVQVFRQRLEQEHGASVIVTAPTVPCRWDAASPGCVPAIS